MICVFIPKLVIRGHRPFKKAGEYQNPLLIILRLCLICLELETKHPLEVTRRANRIYRAEAVQICC